MVLPQIAGVAPLGPGSGVAHFTLSRDQLAGSPVSGEEPLNAGPRHCAQFSGKSKGDEEKAAEEIHGRGRDWGDYLRRCRKFEGQISPVEEGINGLLD